MITTTHQLPSSIFWRQSWQLPKDPGIANIPQEAADRLYLVHKLQKKCVSWYQANTSQHDAEVRRRNARHNFPVAVLEAAITILRDKFLNDFAQYGPVERAVSKHTLLSSFGNAKKTTPVRIALKEENMSNTFGYLTVEHSEDSTHINEHGTTGISPITVPFKPEGLPEEVKLSSADRRLDECILTKYYLFEDIQEIEDTIVLEPDRSPWTKLILTC